MERFDLAGQPVLSFGVGGETQKLVDEETGVVGFT